MKIKLNCLWSLLLILPLVALSCAPAPEVAPPPEEKPPQEVVEYIIPGTTDATGPYAGFAPIFDSANKAVLGWWSDTRGKDIGVKLTYKGYDCRYDPAVVASTWPGILSDHHPIALLALGGATVAALRERVPDDKVVLLTAGATYGYEWNPGRSWILAPSPTWAHHVAANMDWMLTWWPKDQLPIKFLVVHCEGAAAHVDYADGIEAALTQSKYDGKVDFLGRLAVPFAPVDIIDSMRPFVDKGLDLVFHEGPPTVGIAIKSALKKLGSDAIFQMGGGGVRMKNMAELLGSWEALEGDIQCISIVSSANEDIPAYKEIWLEYGAPDKITYDTLVLANIKRGLIFTNAVETAAAKVGAANLTGQTVYDAFYTIDLDEADMMGVSKRVRYTEDAPFPWPDYDQISRVINGKYQVVEEWFPIPEIPKWVE